MLVLLPLVCFVVLFASVYRRSSGDEGSRCWCSSFLGAAILWAVLLTLATELLGQARLLSLPWIAGWWTLASIGAAAVGLRDLRLTGRPRVVVPTGAFPGMAAVAGGLAALLALLGLVAIVAPPNSWDSMVYHLPRVLHWIQNASVDHYPTHIPRQLLLAPWAEFAILHLQVLSGGDRWANLVQWFSLVGSAVGASLIAARLGAQMPGQVLAAVVCATIPGALLEASGTQNNMVAAFWLLCFAYYTVRVMQEGPSLGLACWVGAALGLALLTKGTAYMFALPFVLWYAWPVLAARRSPRVILPLFVAPVILLVLNAGHFGRNLEVYGDVLGATDAVRSSTQSLPALISNGVRNVSLHLSMPLKGSGAAVTNAVRGLHHVIGVDPDDTQTTYLEQRYSVPRFRFSESFASNTLHLLLVVLVSVLALWNRRMMAGTPLVYFACVLAGMILITTLLRWQHISGRLHLPFFVLAAPVLGLVLSRLAAQRVVLGTCWILIIAGLPWILLHDTRPLLTNRSVLLTPREHLYYAEASDYREPFAKLAEQVHETSCSQIGLISGYDFWEYPLWLALAGHEADRIWLEHTLVGNYSSVKRDAPPYRDFKPCLIVSGVHASKDAMQLPREIKESLGSLEHAEENCRRLRSLLIHCSLASFYAGVPEVITWEDEVYRRHWNKDGLAVYLPESADDVLARP